jgi:large-conductance mechanosensitive channel
MKIKNYYFLNVDLKLIFIGTNTIVYNSILNNIIFNFYLFFTVLAINKSKIPKKEKRIWMPHEQETDSTSFNS